MKHFKFLKNLLVTASVLAMTSAIAAPQLPKNLKWITNDSDPVYSDSNAKKGGTFKTSVASFPLTIRNIGPDSNSSFRSYINGNILSLTTEHPNTGNVLPSIATHWAYKGDNKTIYYKLNKNARWSDGKPVTADDFAFTLELMRSKHIIAPWYNNFYTEYFNKVVIFDKHTIAVVGNKPMPKRELHDYYNLSAYPKHSIKLDKNFVKNYQWKVIPNNGPYYITKIKKGKSVTLKRKKDWWGKDLKYNLNRYNVDKVRIKVIRDPSVAYQHFKKGNLDFYDITVPTNWHQKARGKNYDRGYINKMWFYTDAPRGHSALFMNQAHHLLKDKNIRLGIQHSINIDRVIKKVLRGDYERLERSFTGSGKYENKSIMARRFDIAKANKYFNAAGFTKRGPDGIRINDKGQRLSFVVNYGFAAYKDRLVVLKQEAEKTGLELKLKQLDSSTNYKTIMEKKHEIHAGGWGAGAIPAYRQFFHSANANRPQTNNTTNTSMPEMDKLIFAYRNEFNQEKKYEISKKIQQLVHDTASEVTTFLVPYFRSGYWAYWRLPKVPATKVSASAFDVFGATGGLFWLDKDLKKKIIKAKKKGKKFQTPVVIKDTTYKI